MTVQRVAQLFGVVFLLVGVLGLILTPMDMTGGMLLGLFPVNVLHNLVHLLFGVWGLVAARSFAAARTYCQVGGAAYILLTIIGFIAPNPGGLLPLGGNNIWLHALLGLALVYFGFTAKETASARSY